MMCWGLCDVHVSIERNLWTSRSTEPVNRQVLDVKIQVVAKW